MPVSFSEKGVPGRGLCGLAGVEASTGIFARGVPLIVTSIVALVSFGFGEGENGELDGVGVVELP